MLGWYDSIFGNLPGPALPGSPKRPMPPQNPTPMFPVNPAEVAGGLAGIGTDYAGQLGAWLATHPGSTPGLDASAPGLARDLTAMLDKPGEHITPSSAGTFAEHVAPIVATGWAPSAWKKLSQLKQEHPAQADFVDGLANLTPDQARVMPPFGSSLHNKLLDDVVNAHNDDLNLVDRVRGGSPYAQVPLREMRGQPFDDPGSVASLAPPTVQPPSTPWNTFKLQQPNMPPFPANDPRGVRRPPGMTLNSPPPDQPFY